MKPAFLHLILCVASSVAFAQTTGSSSSSRVSSSSTGGVTSTGKVAYNCADTVAAADPNPNSAFASGCSAECLLRLDVYPVLQNFINDFVDSDAGTVAIQTLAANQYTVDVSFLNILQVSGSVDPSSLSASITLYVNIPLAGRVSLEKLEGSLITGITANINVVLVQGTAVLTAQVGPSGKHDLFIQASLTIQFVGTIKTPGNFKILTLPDYVWSQNTREREDAKRFEVQQLINVYRTSLKIRRRCSLDPQTSINHFRVRGCVRVLANLDRDTRLSRPDLEYLSSGVGSGRNPAAGYGSLAHRQEI
ncbi:hypothetical protein DFH09DRAFT_1083454 [Mycena vulgaris]|nr:hypothetical protein DFH09DRAFT_1083454 [Mycena vulgaris]